MKAVIANHKPDGSFYKPPSGRITERIVETPIRLETSTKWLGVENPGMNIELCTPERDDPHREVLGFVFPGGYFSIEAAE